ncbi:hypothetical protein EXIGLDRAFT_169518 [Exidia glandulosa HHB12029]|uniref:Uncharacterized protein n=1 Tax=Exidia glandulosa HHB12029 TaxID=1314781 RepID=A0A166BEC7_EXIGL|nr:hypothetical protein EXIGLDRAFT_169518 [Exidia glandulosa HHB12029]
MDPYPNALPFFPPSSSTPMPFIHRPESGSPPMPALIPYQPFDMPPFGGELPMQHHRAPHPQWWQPPHAGDPYQQHVRSLPDVQLQYVHMPVLHPVFVLSCKHCNLLFSNRGMKAVLLLRPGLALYSTDAVPRNCKPLAAAIADESVDEQLRTCECLTQSLHCVGCGEGVGYFIVSACVQCTGAAAGAANGHRFVFHSTDVVATMRSSQPSSRRVQVHMRPRLAIGPAPSDNPTPTVFWHQLSSAGEVSPILGE